MNNLTLRHLKRTRELQKNVVDKAIKFISTQSPFVTASLSETLKAQLELQGAVLELLTFERNTEKALGDS